MKFKIIFVIIVLLLPFSKQVLAFDDMSNKSYHIGLAFHAHTKNQDERTGFNLTPNKPMHFSEEGFTIDFSLKLRKELHTYGYVCRIVSDKYASFDLISHLLQSEISLVLMDDNKTIASSSISDSSIVVEDKWIDVRLSFRKNKILIKINNKEIAINKSFKNFENIKIYFGANKDPHFSINDVPPMTIKDIIIKDIDESIIYDWNLSTHTGNEVYDGLKGNIAKAENPIWEIDKHFEWKAIKSFTINADGSQERPYPQITYDSLTGRIFIILNNEILVYYINEDRTETLIPQKGSPYFSVGAASQIIFDNKYNRLISYNPSFPKLIFYDFQKNEWSETIITETNTHQHHNKFIDYLTDRLIVFGGYGVHRYNAQLSSIKTIDTQGWDTQKLDSIIHPRYLSSLGVIDDNNIFILGGYGSPSGKQEEFPRNYYDLHKLDIKTQKHTSMWSFTDENHHHTFSNSMVVDEKMNKIYTLAYQNDRYNSHIFLSAFDISTDNPSMSVMSDSIKYNFLDIKSYTDLFLYKENSSLYALVQQEKTPGKSTIDIYSLAFPPLTKDMIASHKAPNTNLKSEIFFGLIFLTVIMLLFVIFCLKRRSKKAKQVLVASESWIEEQEETPNTIKNYTSAIFLLGGFRVFDQKGENITREFSPMLKQIMVYLLLNSIQDGRGTTSQRLDETFWFGMDKDSASNNRRVNIRKLRLILENVGDIEIINKNSYWYLEIGNNVSCDYSEILIFINQLDNTRTSYKKDIQSIVNITTTGILLPNIDAEWLDQYKSQFSQKLINVLFEAINEQSILSDPRLSLRIADIILSHDTIDEDAIRLKSRILYQMKQKGLSKQTYDKFKENYQRLLNTLPDFTFQDIIDELEK